MVNEWDLIWRLALALALSAAIGLERELAQKSAGLRTYTLVGLGSALFMLISKYGFFDVLEPKTVVLDPSRVAAQIVSGIGFIGAGLIFVRRDSVRGLTTAAGVWLTAAVGAACGASLPLLAIATTVAYFAVVFGLSPLARRLPASPYAPSALRLVYEDGRGILRRVLAACTSRDFKVADVNVDRPEGSSGPHPGAVAVSLEVHGGGSVAALAAELGEIDGVLSVAAGDVNEMFD
ncbi:MAG TPA: MgtC/SapB family protein [Solirubrobacterales bacterium]|jgi:putative Mg2+ transporter-C (MgtC) family protein|nr:MgtC/SapB family protein [Solirubrobacterales bacterium]